MTIMKWNLNGNIPALLRLVLLMALSSAELQAEMGNGDFSPPLGLQIESTSQILEQHSAKFFSVNGDTVSFIGLSEAFKKECPDDYQGFKKAVETYYQNVSSHANDQREATDKAGTNALSAMSNCNKKLIEKYLEFYQDKEVEIKAWNIKPKNKTIEKIGDQFNLEQSLPDELEQTKELLTQMKRFKDDCIYKQTNPLTGNSMYVNSSSPHSPYHLKEDHGTYSVGQKQNYAHLATNLTFLRDKNCREKKERLVGLFGEQVEVVEGRKTRWKHLVETPQRCKQPQSGNCVTHLRNWVGLDLAQGYVGAFQSCTERHEIARNCCSSNYESCPAFNKNENISQLLNGSEEKQQGICKAQTKEDIQNVAQNFCDEPSEDCVNFCMQGGEGFEFGFRKFRDHFLQCFSIPSLKEESYALHANNACHKQIMEIKTAFNNALKQASWNTAQIQSLEQFYQGNPSGNHSFPDSCNEARQNQDNSPESNTLAQAYDKTCPDTEEDEEGDEDENEEDKNGEDTDGKDGEKDGEKTAQDGQGQQTAEEILKLAQQLAQQRAGGNNSSGNSSNGGDSNSTPGGLNTGNFQPDSLTSSTRNSTKSRDSRDSMDSIDNLKSDYFPDSYSKSKDGKEAWFSKGYKGAYSSGTGSSSGISTGILSKSEDLKTVSSGSGKSSKGATSSDQQAAGQNSFQQAKSGFSQGGSFAGGSFSGSSGTNSGFDSRGFYGSGSRGSGSSSRSPSGGFKNSLKKGWAFFRGDPRVTVRSAFNVHGSDVDLFSRQKLLALEFCRENQCEL